MIISIKQTNITKNSNTKESFLFSTSIHSLFFNTFSSQSSNHERHWYEIYIEGLRQSKWTENQISICKVFFAQLLDPSYRYISGKLYCVACNVMVKSDALWANHIKATSHIQVHSLSLSIEILLACRYIQQTKDKATAQGGKERRAKVLLISFPFYSLDPSLREKRLKAYFFFQLWSIEEKEKIKGFFDDKTQEKKALGVNLKQEEAKQNEYFLCSLVRSPRQDLQDFLKGLDEDEASISHRVTLLLFLDREQLEIKATESTKMMDDFMEQQGLYFALLLFYSL